MHPNTSKLRSDAENFLSEIESLERTLTHLHIDLSDICKDVKNAFNNLLQSVDKGSEPFADAIILLDFEDLRLTCIAKDIKVQCSCMLSARACFTQAVKEYSEAIKTNRRNLP